MKLEVGKKYRSRIGQVIKITENDKCTDWPFVGGGMSFREDGTQGITPGVERPYDLIQEVSEDKPVTPEPSTEPQPGEWWEFGTLAVNDTSVMFCCGVDYDGERIWTEKDGSQSREKQWVGEPIRHLTDCTGFDYELEPAKPATKTIKLSRWLYKSVDGEWTLTFYRQNKPILAYLIPHDTIEVEVPNDFS